MLLYLGSSGVLVVASYKMSPPTTFDQYKEFGVRAGIALTAVGAFFGLILGLLNMDAQIRAAEKLEVKKGEILTGVEERKSELQRQLENQRKELQKDLEDHKKTILLGVEDRKGEILKMLEDHKKGIALDIEMRKQELVKEIESLKGEIGRQNDFLRRTLDVKSVAYNELFVASNVCYRELQHLAKGEFNKERARECERSLDRAAALVANLDDQDREIVNRIVQKVHNLVDSAEAVEETGTRQKERYIEIWNQAVKSFGDSITHLHNRSLFHNKSTKI